MFILCYESGYKIEIHTLSCYFHKTHLLTELSKHTSMYGVFQSMRVWMDTLRLFCAHDTTCVAHRAFRMKCMVEFKSFLYSSSTLSKYFWIQKYHTFYWAASSILLGLKPTDRTLSMRLYLINSRFHKMIFYYTNTKSPACLNSTHVCNNKRPDDAWYNFYHFSFSLPLKHRNL